jgi:hypothetical protein
MILPIYQWLSQSSYLLAVLGTPDNLRIYRTVAPQDQEKPFIVWNVVAGTVENYLGERPGMDNAIVQLDLYSYDEEQLEMMTAAVSRTLEVYGHQRGVPRDMFDGQPAKLRRISIDFSFWENRVNISPL